MLPWQMFLKRSYNPLEVMSFIQRAPQSFLQWGGEEKSSDEENIGVHSMSSIL